MEQLKKNQKFNEEVIDLSYEGNGVVKCDGLVAFIPGVLVGENVEGVIINAKSKFVVGKAQNISNFSKDRVEPRCPYFLKCGGCQLQHLEYNAQLEFKRAQVQRLLGDAVKIEKTVPSTEYRYRNKVALPVDENGNIGLYRQGSHNVIEVEDCAICKDFIKPLISASKEIIKKGNKLKHVVCRSLSDKLMITLVVKDKKDVNTTDVKNILDNYFKDYSLNLNINTLDNNVILSDKFMNVYGDEQIKHKALDVVCNISNGSFFQVNQEISEAIYKKVLSVVDNNSVIIDCYSGTGLLTAILSKRAKKCYGIEIVESATNEANKLKIENNILNMENINGDCKVVLPKIVGRLKDEKVNIVVDPPRKGLDKKVAQTILSVKPDKIVYISCNPATLARDAQIFLDGGYSYAFAQTFDMFPQTSHVETLCVFELKKDKKKQAAQNQNFKSKYFGYYDDVKIASNDEW